MKRFLINAALFFLIPLTGIAVRISGAMLRLSNHMWQEVKP
ncbi:hypothetical protein [Komagataeibacter nataicola]|nr:hypothetical protein [Komagataeibacter nataicola]WNM09594.1 hypothetical protein RI056_06605 [Komagataeibacter nataicola]GBR23255.1 hypothetical protein AA0616_2477 [Komagataeibacter nataicola NRIC 0616]